MPTSFVDLNAPVPEEQQRAIAALDHNALIIRLHFTVNHLSRWLSPIHDEHKLERSAYRGEPSPKDILILLRNEEHRVFPKMHIISSTTSPNLDVIPDYVVTPERAALDEARKPIELMSQFRRLRQSTCSLLRSLPDDAWNLEGSSRRGYNVTILALARGLAITDYRYLRALDTALDSTGARDGLAKIQRTHLDELLHLTPQHLTI